MPVTTLNCFTESPRKLRQLYLEANFCKPTTSSENTWLVITYVCAERPVLPRFDQYRLSTRSRVGGYGCRFPTRVSLQSVLRFIVSFAVSRFPFHREDRSFWFTFVSSLFMKHPQFYALPGNAFQIHCLCTYASYIVPGTQLRIMVEHTVKVVGQYEQRLRQMKKVPKFSYGRGLLCADGAPNRIFLTCLLTHSLIYYACC
jgi:hypothetical protein